MKRSIDLVDDICAEMRPTKRLSMLHNTPKQWKEQRKSILKLSKSKLKAMGDVESNLRKSVLINNTYKKMRRELKEQCPMNRGSSRYSGYTPDVYGNSRPLSIKANRGYISMAKEDICEYEDIIDVLSPPSDNESSACDFNVTENKTVLENCFRRESIDEEMPINMDCEQSDEPQVDINRNQMCSSSIEPEAISSDSPCMHINQTSIVATEATCTTQSVVALPTGQQDDVGEVICATQTCQQGVIDLTLKAKMDTTEMDTREHSPLDYQHDHVLSVASSQDITTTAAIPSVIDSSAFQPCSQGLSTSSVVNTTTHVNLSENGHEHQQQNQEDALSLSRDCEDFSLCKLAASGSICTQSDAFPVLNTSTGSLVSMLTSREYHSASQSTAQSSFSSIIAHTNTTTSACSVQQGTTKDTYCSVPGSLPASSCIDGSNVTSNNSLQQTSSIITSPTSSTALDYSCSGDNSITHLLGMEELTGALDQGNSLENKDTCIDTLYASLASCDNDVTQHNWACFQHFNMAVACS